MPENHIAAFWNWLTAGNGAALLAGAAGGIVRTMTLRQCDWRDAIVNLGVGSICAIYLGPLAAPILEPAFGMISADTSGATGFTGFVIGLGGVTISGAVLDVIHLRRRMIEKQARDAEGKRDDP